MSLFLTVSALALIISIVHSEMLKNQAQGKASCNRPLAIKYGKLIEVNNTDPNKIAYRLICDDGYYPSSNHITIICQRGTWPRINVHCEEYHSRKLYHILLVYVLPSVVIVIVSIIAIITVIIRKKRSIEPVPKWTKNKEEREKKYSSEMQEKVYKDLIETSRTSFRFPFFWPKGRTTGKKPILLEEDGYLVPERRRKNYDSTDVRNIEFGNRNPNMEVAATNVGTGNSAKYETFPKVIKELESKQAGLVLSSNDNAEKKNKSDNIEKHCNLISGSSGVSRKNEETTQNADDLKATHTYVNVETRENIVLKEVTVQEDYINDHSKDLQVKALKQPVDTSSSNSLLPSCKRKPSTKQNNITLTHKQQETVATPITTSNLQLKACCSLPNPRSPEDRGDASGKSVNEPESTLSKRIVSTSDRRTYIEITDVVVHREPVSTENKPLKEKHLYCNLIVDSACTDEIVEEIYDDVPLKSLHTYANVPLS